MKLQFMSVPGFTWDFLQPGIYPVDLEEIEKVFATTTHRKKLYFGFICACRQLKSAGCMRVYLDGSFVTKKPRPGDFDACWDPRGVNTKILDPVFFDFKNKRATQKSKFYGEFFPTDLPATDTGVSFLDFFRRDSKKNFEKGIILISLNGDPLL